MGESIEPTIDLPSAHTYSRNYEHWVWAHTYFSLRPVDQICDSVLNCIWTVQFE